MGHTTETDLRTVTLPTGKTIRLHPAAATAFEAALRLLVGPDLDSIVNHVTSAFRPWDKQVAMIASYEKAIGEPWKAWSKLNAGQLVAAKVAGFAYHPGFPVDAPHTHVGGGALDISPAPTTMARAALEANGFRRDTPGDEVHWGWHGVSASVPVQRSLALGRSGEDVKKLQRLLGVTADGVFGLKTQLAVKTFQTQHGLTPDGVVGPATRTALKWA